MMKNTKIGDKDYLQLKREEEVISEESVTINDKITTFELSIHRPTWNDDGCYSFGQFDSILRIKYSNGSDYKSIIKDLAKIERLFQFCANRNEITFDNIFFESKDETGKYIPVVEVIVPYMIDNEVNKYILDYDLLEGRLSKLINILKESNYVFSTIPDDDKEFHLISNKDYSAAFSCFQSIYQYIHNADNLDENIMTSEEIALNEVKNEILPLLDELDEKYKGKSRKKRDYVQRFKNIISTANLEMVKCIKNEIEKNSYLIDDLFYKTRDQINNTGIYNSIKHAVDDRDDITHNKTVSLDDISKGIYQIVNRLNYIMILDYAGIEKKKIENAIRFLVQRDII